MAILAGAAGWAAYVWISVNEVELGLHGYAALALGVVLSLGLGVGLMSLVFYSSRKGRDDI